ncbi:MAG: GDSL-type esterase/lipase family protein [Candidatus Omnitrophica bacterium]|nr:GDSL-type esterase/lipase family protein [Candidatus Omnitrophota bacterium]
MKKENKSKPGLIKNLLFMGIVFGFIAVFLECVGRIVLAFYPESYFITKFEATNRFQSDYTYGWDWRPGFKASDDKFGRVTSFSVSEQGFKDRDFSLQKPANTIRIACVGDSITEGVGVANADTYPKLLEKYLNSMGSQKKFEVINAGVSDYSLPQEYFYIKHKIVNFHPDIVILGYYLNDGRNFARPKNFYGGGVLKFLLERSAFVKWLNLYVTKVAIKVQYKQWEKGRERWMEVYRDANWKNDTQALKNLMQAADRDWGSAWIASGQTITRAYIQDLHSLARARNFKLVVLCFPLTVQLYAQKPGDIDLYYPQKFMQGLCKEYKIPYLDLVGSLKKHQNEKIYYDHCHFAERGREIVAEDIQNFLIANHLI